MFGNDEVDGNAALGGGIWLIPGTQNGLNNGNPYWTTQYLPNSADSSGYPMLTALQAYQLDQKTDDGSPQSGNLRAVKFANDVNSPGGQYMTNDDNNKWEGNSGEEPYPCLTASLTAYNVKQTIPACTVAYKAY